MGRKNVPQTSHFPYHITSRCQNKQKFPCDLDTVWNIMQEELFLCNKMYDFKIHSFVLMPNHYHLVGSLGEPALGENGDRLNNLGKILHHLQSNAARRVNEAAGVENHLWGSRAFRCEIDRPYYFENVYRYVYQNPIRAGLTQKCEDWKYSTLNGLLGQNHLLIPVEEDTLLFSPNFDDETYHWLNKKIEPEILTLIKKGLKKKKFGASEMSHESILLRSSRKYLPYVQSDSLYPPAISKINLGPKNTLFNTQQPG